MVVVVFFSCFFFQAEDGIRDWSVTGVQTCALPIYRDRTLRMNFMIPNFETTMYANGYVWHHQTDALGFRNATLHIPADVVVLGDSLVYGQGVDFEDTLGNRLEERSGLRVVNLGRQGDCALQEAYRLSG